MISYNCELVDCNIGKSHRQFNFEEKCDELS